MNSPLFDFQLADFLHYHKNRLASKESSREVCDRYHVIVICIRKIKRNDDEQDQSSITWHEIVINHSCKRPQQINHLYLFIILAA